MIVEHGQVLHLGEVLRVLDGDGAELRHGAEDAEVLRVEAAVALAVHQLDHAEDAPLEGERHAENRLGVEARGLVEPGGEAGVGGHIVHDERRVVLRHPARDAFAALEPQVHEHLAARADRRLEVQLSRLRVAQQQRPVAGLQELGDLGQDEVHHLADVQGRGERLADLVEHRQLVHGALQLAEQVACLHQPECNIGAPRSAFPA